MVKKKKNQGINKREKNNFNQYQYIIGGKIVNCNDIITFYDEIF